jgi:WD40 repeat protein
MAVGSAGQSPFGGHAGRVLAVAFRPGGLFVATGGGDGTVRVWDVGTGEQRIQLEGHTGPVRSIAYSPDGRVIASAGDDWTIGIWDADTGEQRAQLTGHTGLVRSVVYNRRGDWIASASADRTVRIWDAETGEQFRHLLPRPSGLNAVAFSPDGELIACAGNDPAVWIWRIRADSAPERRLTGHASRVNAVAFSPDGGLIASAGADRSIKIWDPQTGEMRSELSGARATVNAIAFGYSGQAIASAGENGKVLIWDLATGLAQELADHRARVNCVAYNPAAPAVVATASDDGTARVWEVASRTELRQLKGHTGPITLVAYSPGGDAIATAGADRQVRIWDAATGNVRTPQLSNHRPVAAMAYSPRRASATMVTVDEGSAVRIWDLTSGLYQEPNEGPEDSISAVAFKLDGSAFATAIEDHTILIWDAATGRPVKRLRGHRAPVTSVAYRADGTIVSGARDGTVRVWKTDAEEPQGTDTDQAQAVFSGFFGEVWSVACSLGEDSAAIAAAGGDGTILVWDVDSREQLARLESHGGPVYSMAYDPTGSVIAAACSDGTVKIWEAGTFAQRPQLTGHTSAVRSLAFSPDGARIATCGYDGTIRVWDARTSEQVAGSGFGVPRAPRLPLPGVRSDSPSAVDRIGIDRDVETLAALIAAKDTSAPLAIALIGEWGAGKSSLMRLVDARVGQLAAASANNRSATAFATSVCPIHFNAWHYSSSHLWASLARAMFQALSLPDGQEPGADIGSDPEKLRAELDRRRKELAEFQRADKQLASDLEKASNAEPPSGYLRPLDSPAGLVRTFAAAYREALGDVKTSWTALLGWLALAAALVCVLVFLRPQLRLASGLIIGAIVVLQPAVRQLRRMWRWHQQLLATKEKLAKELRQKKSDLEQETIKAQQHLELVDAQYRFIEFVQDQGNSAIYREGRGLVGDVHDNLVALSDKLRQARRQWVVDDTQPEPPERIVLYIDDLDRCPPDRVVEMLEAVNLILTLDVFIVVVAVDARWMIRSLECHYREFFGGVEAISADPDYPAADHDRIAPYDYLDKIFQIPYTLVAPRNPQSARYLRSLLPEPRLAAGSGAIVPDHNEDAGPDRESGQEASDPQADHGTAPAAIEDQAVEETVSGDQPVAEPASADQAGESRTVLDLQPPSLWLSHAEVEFMTRLGSLTPSPRAAKRMANLYRLVRISIREEELAGFLGDANGGPYRVVQVLIAILTGAPGIAYDLFQRISDAGETDSLLDELEPHDGQAREDRDIMADIRTKLERLSYETGLPLEISAYRDWCPDLARYSFRTWRLARELAAREDNSTQSWMASAASTSAGGG